jgi:hypothetical protein
LLALLWAHPILHVSTIRVKKTQICDSHLGLSVRVPLVVRHKSKPYSTSFQTLDHIYLPTDPQASRRSVFNLSKFWSEIGLRVVCLTTISEKEPSRSDIRRSSVWNDTDLRFKSTRFTILLASKWPKWQNLQTWSLRLTNPTSLHSLVFVE